MIREWESGCQKVGKQRTQERKPAEGMWSKTGTPVRICTMSDSFRDKDSLCSQRGLCPASPLEIWTKFYKSDPRIALGKYSPLEKEILRLGGVHTVAAKRLLIHKQEEEWKMLKEQQSLSSDYKRAMDYRTQHSPPCATYRPLEKIWTAKVIVPPEELRMPQREQLTIVKHVERMQLARALRNRQLLGGLCPTMKDKTREDEDDADADFYSDAKQEEKGDVANTATKRQEINMNVIFKSEEPKKCFTHQPNDRKPFLSTKRVERSITGLTNQNLLHVAEFPGDLMLMNQDFISRGAHPTEATKASLLGEESLWKEYTHKASHRY
uniref:Chromosome 10 open reading frame 120 n=1 Tax=Ursus americanus TaxID=9643 RepID=A0A452SEI4_URSAM